LQGIPFEREIELPIYYKNSLLNKKYVPDFICFLSIIVELKATEAIRPEHKAQVINYLKATKFELGLLINFGTVSLTSERLVRLKERS
jgi:GxxExxY protein